MFHPSPHRRSTTLPFPPFMVVDGGRSSLSYSKLPEMPIKLSVLKLDGSCFEIEVMKSATVAELRQAVEAVFWHMPRKGPGKISWFLLHEFGSWRPHVWGHFCLMYDGQKLVAETDCIKDYGIRDGDQLRFIRHLSTTYSLTKKGSTKRVDAPEQYRISPSQLDNYEEGDHIDKEDDTYEDIECGRYPQYDEKAEDSVERKESKWAFFLKQWFPYSRLPTMEKLRSFRGSPSRSGSSFFGNFSRKIIQICGDDNHYSPKDTWRED